ncbi:MAG: UbiD family decarboxylase [Methanocellales archaeon]|nr:UbiD family decarboxylase [Methanocellales archaeon]
MSFRNFIKQLAEAGKLMEIHEPVSPKLEAPAMAKKAGQPILFYNVNGSKVVMNLLNSRDILAMVLDTSPKDIINRLINARGGSTAIVDNSPTKEVVSEPDLSKLPIMTHFDKDGAPYITAGVLVSEFEGVMNASVHRLMVLSKTELVARLVAPRHTYLLHKKASERGKPLPIAIAIGIDPITLFAACTRVPEGEEFNYASALKRAPVELFRCENGIRVPHAEMVLEGYIHPTRRAPEGPFVDITGTYDLTREEPVIELTRMMHRRDFIYHGILPAGGEHKLLMGVPYEPRIYEAVGKIAKVKNVVLTEGGCCYLHAVVQIEKQREEDGKNAILAALSAHHSLKHVIVVDDDINIFDLNDIEYAMATRVKGDRDVMTIPHVRGSSLDPCNAPDGTTTKMGIDATKTIGEEKFERATNRFEKA